MSERFEVVGVEVHPEPTFGRATERWLVRFIVVQRRIASHHDIAPLPARDSAEHGSEVIGDSRRPRTCE
jgi:hypothetical protein